MKKNALILIIAFCLVLTACGRDAQINEFIAENHALVEEMVKKIDADPSEAGVDEAQKTFDAKKDALKAKWDAIKNARGTEVSPEVMKKLNDGMLADRQMFADVQRKNAQKLAASGDATGKLAKLMKAYADLFRQEK